MRTYIFKRILSAVVIMWAVATIVFFAMRVVPSDPAFVVLGNYATEEAIKAFQEEKCPFFSMSDMVLDAYKKFEDVKAKNIDEIIQIDKEVRAYANAR